MASTVYLLCAFTSFVCTILLARAYRASRVRLLFWSIVCFAGLTVSNILLVVDLVLTSSGPDLLAWRTGVSLAAVGSLLYGLIADAP
jgi:hypothetical protein